MNYNIEIDENLYSRELFSQRHKNVSCILHIHPSYEIVCVTSGTLNMQIGKKCYTIPEGNAVFILPYEPHSFESKEGNTCHVLMFPGSLIPEFSDFLSDRSCQDRMFSLHSDTRSIIDRILPCDDNLADTVKAQAVLMPLCSEILDGCVFSVKKEKSDDLFLRTLDLLYSGSSESLSLDGIAGDLGIHPVTLCKMFSEKAGMTIHSYINSLRCCKAVLLLSDGSKTMTDICFLSGFSSIRSFNRVFRSFHGKTPSQYRKMLLDMRLQNHITQD